jgi:hypothetical protein
MTRKQAVRIEKELRARGIHKPYVSPAIERTGVDSFEQGKAWEIESYPLGARIVPGFDKELGPTWKVTVNACSLPRIGQDARIAELTLGQDTTQHVAAILLHLHPEAYERAKRQEQGFIEQSRDAQQRHMTAMAKRTVSA